MNSSLHSHVNPCCRSWQMASREQSCLPEGDQRSTSNRYWDQRSICSFKIEIKRSKIILTDSALVNEGGSAHSSRTMLTIGRLVHEIVSGEETFLFCLLLFHRTMKQWSVLTTIFAYGRIVKHNQTTKLLWLKTPLNSYLHLHWNACGVSMQSAFDEQSWRFEVHSLIPEIVLLHKVHTSHCSSLWFLHMRTMWNISWMIEK